MPTEKTTTLHCKRCGETRPATEFQRIYTALQAIKRGYGTRWTQAEKAAARTEGINLPEFKRIPRVKYTSTICKTCRPQAPFVRTASATERLTAASLGLAEGITKDAALTLLEQQAQERAARRPKRLRGVALARKHTRDALLAEIRGERVATKRRIYYAERSIGSGPLRMEYLQRYLRLVNALELFVDLELDALPMWAIKVHAYMPVETCWHSARLVRLLAALCKDDPAIAAVRKRARKSDQCRGKWLFEEAGAHLKPHAYDDLFEDSDIVAQAQFEYGAATGRTPELLTRALRGRAPRGRDKTPRTRRTRDQIKADNAEREDS